MLHLFRKKASPTTSKEFDAEDLGRRAYRSLLEDIDKTLLKSADAGATQFTYPVEGESARAFVLRYYRRRGFSTSCAGSSGRYQLVKIEW